VASEVYNSCHLIASINLTRIYVNLCSNAQVI